LREALARKSIANLNYLNRRQALEREIRAAYNKFRLAERDMSLYPENSLKRFDENLDLNQRAYQEGQIDLSDTIVFQNQVIEARQKFIDALTNYNLAVAELKFHAGVE
jgi:outer membrane protein TolC